ncbi:MAG: YkgJ family cysteine cluster protein [Bacteroidales bacterium]|nr:YkgJ family cysteine cluster protein [Bacteroidales bacterium]
MLKHLFSKLGKLKPAELDLKVHRLHHEVFSEINCLECANCCKTISPTLYEADISRLADCLKMKVAVFKDQYVKTDEDGDYVFNQTPCPFLDDGNYCLVYNNRPKACREYPHTDRKRFYQILDITAKNVAVCPAVYAIVEKLKSET